MTPRQSAIERPRCECGSTRLWRECYNCGGEGCDDHECGDDTCCCLRPEANVRCDICHGVGGWWQCAVCHPFED